jgi:hypothetical protein
VTRPAVLLGLLKPGGLVSPAFYRTRGAPDGALSRVIAALFFLASEGRERGGGAWSVRARARGAVGVGFCLTKH